MIEFKQFTEGLSFLGRRKLSRKMKISQPRLKQAKKRADRKTAPEDKILRRAVRRARNQVAANFLKGKSRSKLSAAGKSRLEAQINARAGVVKAKTKRVLPKVRKDDRKRKG